MHSRRVPKPENRMHKMKYMIRGPHKENDERLNVE